MQNVDPIQAELLTKLCQTLASTQQAIREPAWGASGALEAVNELQRLLSEQSPVVIRKPVSYTHLTLPTN